VWSSCRSISVGVVRAASTTWLSGRTPRSIEALRSAQGAADSLRMRGDGDVTYGTCASWGSVAF
jgi:hypothetical protein